MPNNEDTVAIRHPTIIMNAASPPYCEIIAAAIDSIKNDVATPFTALLITSSIKHAVNAFLGSPRFFVSFTIIYIIPPIIISINPMNAGIAQRRSGKNTINRPPILIAAAAVAINLLTDSITSLPLKNIPDAAIRGVNTKVRLAIKKSNKNVNNGIVINNAGNFAISPPPISITAAAIATNTATDRNTSAPSLNMLDALISGVMIAIKLPINISNNVIKPIIAPGPNAL